MKKQEIKVKLIILLPENESKKFLFTLARNNFKADFAVRNYYPKNEFTRFMDSAEGTNVMNGIVAFLNAASSIGTVKEDVETFYYSSRGLFLERVGETTENSEEGDYLCLVNQLLTVLREKPHNVVEKSLFFAEVLFYNLSREQRVFTNPIIKKIQQGYEDSIKNDGEKPNIHHGIAGILYEAEKLK